MKSKPKTYEFDENNIATRGEATREILLKTAMAIFARDGFDAASTRAIADEAGVNQALISYHFRTKRGLYCAVFEHIVVMVKAILGEKMEVLSRLIEDHTNDEQVIMSALFAFSDTSIDMLVSNEMTDKAKLILREQQSPTEAFDIVYNGFMFPVMNQLTTLVERLRPDLEGEKLKLLVTTMFTQVIALRAARSTIMRFMGWDSFSNDEVQKLKMQIRENFQKLNTLI